MLHTSSVFRPELMWRRCEHAGEGHLHCPAGGSGTAGVGGQAGGYTPGGIEGRTGFFRHSQLWRAWELRTGGASPPHPLIFLHWRAPTVLAPTCVPGSLLCRHRRQISSNFSALHSPFSCHLPASRQSFHFAFLSGLIIILGHIEECPA